MPTSDFIDLVERYQVNATGGSIAAIIGVILVAIGKRERKK
jgi:hypothetical protein